MIKNLKNKKKGFTLVELIVVIAILAILAAVALPKLGEVRTNAAWKSDIANAKTIANATTIALAEEKLDDTATTVQAVVDAGALQSVPTPKSKNYSAFTITISSGNVTVKMDDQVMYPNASETPVKKAS